MCNNSDNAHILDTAYELLIEKGFKATTMDSIAKKLQMSKRTLYEIYENKNDLIIKVLKRHRILHKEKCDEIYRTSPNLIEALVRIFTLHREDLKKVNNDFFRDMDRLYPSLKEDFESNRREVITNIERMFAAGVEQGVFLRHLNYKALTQILLLQMESMKRMEDNFTDDLSHAEIFDTMSICFLRSVVSQKGMELLDSNLSAYFPDLTK